MSLFTVLGVRYAWATVQGNGGPSRNRKAGASEPLWSRGECQDETLVQLYFPPHGRRCAPMLAGNRDAGPNAPRGPRHCARATTAPAKTRPASPHIKCDPVYRPTGLDRVVATTLGRPHEPHRIRHEHLQHLPVDAWKHTRDQPSSNGSAPRCKSAFSLDPAPSETG